MNKISSYDELRAERRKTEGRIVEHKARINKDFIELKATLSPFLYLIPVLSIFKKRDLGHPVLNAAASLGIDVVAGQTLFSKAGWFVRLVVPRLLKTLSAKAFSFIKT